MHLILKGCILGNISLFEGVCTWFIVNGLQWGCVLCCILLFSVRADKSSFGSLCSHRFYCCYAIAIFVFVIISDQLKFKASNVFLFRLNQNLMITIKTMY